MERRELARERGLWRPAEGPPQVSSRAVDGCIHIRELLELGEEPLKGIDITIPRTHTDQG